MNEGAKLSISGSFTNDGVFLLCKANGETVDGFERANGGSATIVLGPVTETGNHFLVFIGEAFETNRFNGTVSNFVE